jgi:queuine tRNA-ribosyltransferase
MERFSDTETGKFSRAYIRHLIVAGEILGSVILTLHNVRFYLDLMQQARDHIEAGTYTEWSSEWMKRYEQGSK